MSESGWGEVRFTPDQWPLVKSAIDRVRRETDVPDLSYSRALELIVADYLAGPLP